jgi:beta-glucosidase
MSCFCTYENLGEAVERGLITEAEIDTALARTLATRFKLGMFDPPEQVPYTSISLDVVNCEAHQDLAYETAVKSVVLLKNNNDILPLGEDTKSMMVVGPNAASLDVLLGNYAGISDSMTTLLEGVAGAMPEGLKVDYRLGCTLTMPAANPSNWTVWEAIRSDVVLAFMGLSPQLEGEEGDAILAANYGDRPDLSLPQVQVDFIKSIAAVGAKIVLVLCGGSPIELGELVDLVEAIVFVWYPGQAGGTAVADVLFGNVSPSGKLPITFPMSVDQLPPFEDYAMSNRTYRYSQETPQYPFGFGLSYSQFAYTELMLAQDEVENGESVQGKFTLTNSGTVEAEEVAQLYLTDIEASALVPQHKLVRFERVRLQPGESKIIPFTIVPEMMMFADEAGQFQLEPGTFHLTIGGCSPGTRGQELGVSETVTGEFIVI